MAKVCYFISSPSMIKCFLPILFQLELSIGLQKLDIFLGLCSQLACRIRAKIVPFLVHIGSKFLETFSNSVKLMKIPLLQK